VVSPADFTPEPAPDGLRCWRLPNPPSSTLYGCPVDVTVLLELLELPDADFVLINTVVADVDRYLTAAAEFVEQRLRDDPAFFGLTEPPAAPGLDLPEVTFSDAGWLVRFAEAPYPIADPYGLLVEFEGETPVLVDGTADAEAF
jgi:hypothetical protein